MDEALWGPPHNQEESLYDFQKEHHDFHDVIEEEALNEKYCLQVLRILVAKTDAEIIELGEDILMLTTQLALANEDWSKLCFAALRERIDHLEILIQSVKDNITNEHDPHVQSQLHREPAEKIHVILKDLLSNNFQPKAEQPAKTFDISPSILEADDSKKEDSGNYSSEECQTLDRKEDFESEDEDAGRNPFAKPQDLMSNAEKLEAEKLKEEKKLNNRTSGIGSTISLEKHRRPPSSSPAKKEDVVEEHRNDDSIIRDPAKDVLTGASVECREKDLRKIDPKDKQITEKHSSVPKKAADTPNPPLIDEYEQSAIALEKDIYTLGDEPAFSGQNMQEKILSEASSLEEAVKQSSVVDSLISKTCLDLVLMEKKSAGAVKVEAAFLDCKSDATKLIVKDSSVKQEPMRTTRALEAAESNLRDARKKLVPTRKMKTKTDGRINGKKRMLHKTEYNFPESLLELLKYNRREGSKPPLNVTQKSQVRHIPKHEACSTDKCSSNLSLKRKCPFLKEPCLAEELGLTLASLGKFKRQRKSGIVVKNASGCSENKNFKKENQQNFVGAKMYNAASDVIIASFLQQPKERKISEKSPVVRQNKESTNFQIESSNMLDNTTESTMKKGLTIVNYSSDDSDNENLKSPAFPKTLNSYLEGKGLIELRAIAKKLNLRRYSKLPKLKLIRLLVPELQTLQLEGETR